MNQYINTAELIRQDRSYKRKIVYKLETHILKTAACIRSLSRRHRGHSAKTAFFAIAAPSMEGKTQSAFVFKRLKPLYFPLSTGSQLVYRNFSALSIALKQYAEADLQAIKQSERYTRGTPFISASSIQNQFMDVKLKTLGFLVQLVRDARANFEASRLPWMKYHAQRQNFEFHALSFEDLKASMSNYWKQFSGFCLFLDEFFDSEWSVFVRNLARSIGLRCVVANTNSRIGNLVGRLRSSGADSLRVWSIVITRLDPSDQFILDGRCGLSTSLTEICNMVGSREEREAITFFFEKFLHHHISHLRPGIAVFAAQVFKEFVQKFRTDPNRINLKVFLDFVISNLCKLLTIRKPTLSQEDAAIYGNIGLLLPETFSRYTDNSDATVQDVFFKSYRFLEYHLFYLHNPQNPNHWIFYTFPPVSNRTFLKVPRGDNTQVEWKLEFTYFDKDEILGLLGCMFIPFARPLTSILQDAEQENASHPSRVGNSPNLNAPVRSGNLLEVSAAVSVVDASHHPQNFQISSLSGQKGTVFLNNLIVNLIKNPNFLKFTRKCIKYPTVGGFDLKRSFFDQCHIPYLYSINREDSIFESICAKSPTVFVSKCTRTSNDEEIDGRFEFRFADNSLFEACIECKDYSSEIGSGMLRRVLKKALHHSPESKLSLIFCESFVERSTTNSAFTQFCLNESINVYRVKAIQRGFEIVPFSGSFKISRDPRLICILFESNKINNLQ